MGLKEVMIMMKDQEYGRAASVLEDEEKDGAKSPKERIELCEWLAECHRGLEDHKMAGDWHLQAVKRVFSQQLDVKTKAKQALPFCQKALDSYKLGGDAVDILEAGKLKQRLLELSR